MVSEFKKFTKTFPELKKPSNQQKEIVNSTFREVLLSRRQEISKKISKLIEYTEDGTSTTFFIDLPSGASLAEAYLRKTGPDSIDLQQISIGKMSNSNDMFRGLGIGTILIQKIFNYCIKRNIQKLTLKVDLDNLQALRLYKKLGFSVVKEDEDFFYMVKRFNY